MAWNIIVLSVKSLGLKSLKDIDAYLCLLGYSFWTILKIEALQMKTRQRKKPFKILKQPTIRIKTSIYKLQCSLSVWSPWIMMWMQTLNQGRPMMKNSLVNSVSCYPWSLFIEKLSAWWSDCVFVSSFCAHTLISLLIFCSD
jgi:hypothetical protein